jgi:ribosomal protein S27E
MGRASDWLREERRKTLGDWVAFCLDCGHVQRYFEEFEAELPATCPACGGELRARCPSCEARIASAFAVACEVCDAKLRPPEAFGVPIRRPPEVRTGSRRSG